MQHQIDDQEKKEEDEVFLSQEEEENLLNKEDDDQEKNEEDEKQNNDKDILSQEEEENLFNQEDDDQEKNEEDEDFLSQEEKENLLNKFSFISRASGLDKKNLKRFKALPLTRYAMQKFLIANQANEKLKVKFDFTSKAVTLSFQQTQRFHLIHKKYLNQHDMRVLHPDEDEEEVCQQLGLTGVQVVYEQNVQPHKTGILKKTISKLPKHDGKSNENEV